MTDLINSEEDAVKFELLILEYIKTKTDTNLSFIDIAQAYRKLKPHENYGSRIFSALLDLKINMLIPICTSQK
jgi:hypothetical protein